jgi:hypothetical protein
MNDIVRDGGYKSRKLAFSFFAVITIFAGWIIAGKYPAMAALYDTFVGGVVAIAGLFLTGSVATKWVGTKAPADPPKPKKEDPPKPPPARFPEDE